MRQEVVSENTRRLGGPVYFNENVFEHALTYVKDDKRVELALIHLPGSEPTLSVATFEIENNPNCAPATHTELGMDEVRVRFAFMKRLQEAGLLD